MAWHERLTAADIWRSRVASLVAVLIVMSCAVAYGVVSDDQRQVVSGIIILPTVFVSQSAFNFIYGRKPTDTPSRLTNAQLNLVAYGSCLLIGLAVRTLLS